MHFTTEELDRLDAELLPERQTLGHGGVNITLAWVAASNSATAVNALTLFSFAGASANQAIIIG